MSTDDTTETPEPEPEPEAETEARAEPEPEAREEPETEAGAEPEAPEEPTPVAPAGAEAPRRLMRSRDDRVIAGVCGGLGEYLGVDPVLVRIAALILVFAGGAGILLYIIGWIAMPEAPERPAAGTPAAASEPARPAERRSGSLVLGFIFVALGFVFLADEVWPDFFSWHYVWPIALIVVGAAIVLRSRR